MISKRLKKGIAVLFSMAVLSFTVTGCGGGGGGGGDITPPATGIQESEKVTITEENSEQATSAVFSAIDTGFGFEDGYTSTADTPIVKTMQQPAFKKVLSSAQGLKTLAESGSYECSEGGSVSYSGTETSGTITYNNCQEAGTTINGTMAVTTNSTATSGSITFTNFSMTSGDTTMYYESATYSYAFDANYELTSMTVTMDGYVDILGEKTDYDSYEFKFDMDSNYNVTLTVNGFVKPSCLGAWIEISTIEAIKANYADDCPNAGKIIVGGNASDLTITFNADQSADVTINGGALQHYNSCNDLDTGVCN